jgi:4-hydroxy-tetrahydrodipicolinate synthase
LRLEFPTPDEVDFNGIHRRSGVIVFQGIHTALITPFRDGAVDGTALERLVERQLQAGVSGFVLFTAAGEGPLLSKAERKRVFQHLAAHCPPGTPVIADCTAMSLEDTADLTRLCADMGARAALVASPPYLQPSDDGAFEYLLACARICALPVIVYNVPARVNLEWTLPALVRLSRHENIIGLCDASANVSLISQLSGAMPDGWTLFSASDSASLSMLIAGCGAIVSTSANLVPERHVLCWQHWQAGQSGRSQEIMAALAGFHDALSQDPTSGAIKAALNIVGLCQAEVRLPGLWPLRPVVYRIAAEIDRLGIEIRNGETP